MKKNTCLFVWLGGFALAVLLRTVEMLRLTEYNTGFIKPAYKFWAVLITVLIGSATAFSAIFISRSTKEDVCQIGFDLVLSLSTFMLGIAATVSAVTEKNMGVPSVLRLLCIVFAVLSSIYFIAFAVRAFVYFPFTPALSAIPVLFFVFKAASVAIKGAYHTVISDTLFEIAAYCFIMLFFLEFVRTANGSTHSGSVKKIAAFGTAASILSLTASLPKIIVSVIFPSALHDSSKSEYLLFFVGVYIACEVFCRLCFVQDKGKKTSLYYAGKH